MNEPELRHYIEKEISDSGASVSLLVYDYTYSKTIASCSTQRRLVSASTIKTPIMMTAFDLVRQGKLSLKQMVSVPKEEILPDSEVFEFGPKQYSLEELITWMIISSDNSAANVTMSLLGLDTVNHYCASLGLEQTSLQRRMLDWDALKAGLNNYTSAGDQFKLFTGLYQKNVLTPELCDLALSILKRQRVHTLAMRYLCPGDASFAHKTGDLDFVRHDTGIFYLPGRDYYFGCFVTDAMDDTDENPTAARLIGRISKAVYDFIRE